MTYELVKRLKDAGFPHKFDTSPTLTELIMACGKEFNMLLQDPTCDNKWIVYSKDGHLSRPLTTPEEAVASLWLELNPTR